MMGNRLKYSVKKLKSYLRSKIFGKYAIGVIYDTKNGRISAPIGDLQVGRKLGKKGEYDLSEVNLIKTLISPSDTMLFVGVHWGTLLIPISKCCHSIIGYEANPNTFYFLENNLKINDVDNAKLFNLAAGDSEKKIEFYLSRINTGGSKIKPQIDDYMYNYDNPEVVEVDMVNVDNHLNKFDMPAPNGIIMDIEGSEFYALQGMANTLQKSDFLYIEYVPHHLKNISKTTNKTFFDLIFPYYNKVKSMGNSGQSFDLIENKNEFMAYINQLTKQDKADNLLFSK